MSKVLTKAPYNQQEVKTMLSIGNIVQIICQKYTECESFGEVVEIKSDGMVRVKIPKIFPNETKTICCHPDDLEFHDDYPLNVKASQLFGKLGWHLCRGLETPLQAGMTECQYKNCSHKAVRRAIINIYGVACEVDLCTKHADKYHGTWCEIFYWKEKSLLK